MRTTPLYLELLARLAFSLSILPDKPEETPSSCLEALWHKATGIELSAAAAGGRPLDPLDSTSERELRRLIDARLAGEPLAYLVGRQQFMGLEFISTPEAVIPRKDTEPLANAVLNRVKQMSAAGGRVVVVDVFTGSGNVPLSLASLAPGPRYFGSDISPVAIELANRNANHLRLASECTFLCSDMFKSYDPAVFHGQVDLICGAPPFISSSKVPNMPSEISKHEPVLAFDAGPFGVSLFLRLIADAPVLLKSGGWLFFEVGLGQAGGVLRRLATDSRYNNLQEFSDHKGDVRAVAAQRK